MARKSKKEVQEKPNKRQKVNPEDYEIQTTFNTDPISELVADGKVENAVYSKN